MSEILAVVPMAFMLSLSHCIAMCGGFVVAYSAKLNSKTKKLAFIYSFVYQISRVFAYAILGLIAGYFGYLFTITSKFMGYFHFFIGVFLVFIGYALIKRGEILKFLENDKIWSKFIAKPFRNLAAKDSLIAFGALGFLNGLIPCGLVYTFIAMAMLSGSVIKGVIIMTLFGISTLPSLLFLSFISNFLNSKFQKTMLFVSAIIVMAYGIYSMYGGFLAIK
ncbi:sulfite exporter TauE/SafE family protein [Campylobacter corcagiensis]|nr:sulfite exporter TauE/SafE family protein [Campylobacter corcagiensis]QKF65296.1 sulfite exporter TauE/SafE family protein (DsbD_2 domain) [Campylobacter corcagiensis]